MDILKHFGRIVLVDKEKAYTFKKYPKNEFLPIVLKMFYDLKE